MDYMEDTGKYWWGNMEKPGAREGQEGTGDIWYKRGSIGQLHDGISFVNLTVSRVLQLCCFHCKIRAIDSYNNQWD